MAVAAVRTVVPGGAPAFGAAVRFTHAMPVKNRQVRLLPESVEALDPGAKLAVSSLTVPAAIDARIQARDNPRPPDEIPPVLARAEVQLDGPGARTALYELRKRAELKLAAFGLGHYMVAIVEYDGAADVTIVPCVPDGGQRRPATQAPFPALRGQQRAVATVTAASTVGTGGALAMPAAVGVRRA